ncbi:MAG: chromosome segregation ATPase, partial [Subdoligranulum sp.]|nr:chromosome segregation ATPase [Subdoligranulum sp.]
AAQRDDALAQAAQLLAGLKELSAQLAEAQERARQAETVLELAQARTQKLLQTDAA